MGYDPFSPVSLAQVNVLCVAASEITTEKFTEYLRAFRAFNLVATNQTTSTSTVFSYKNGHILLNFDGSVHNSGPIKDEKADINTVTQILIGFVDGEQLATAEKADADQQLQIAKESFGQAASSGNRAAIKVLIVLGGRPLPSSLADVYFVDLEGDGPSIFDVIKETVSRFQDSVETRVRETQRALQEVSNTENDVSAIRTTQSGKGSTVPGRTGTPTTGGDASGSGSTERLRSIVEQSFKLGQFFLLTGQWPEAMYHFTEGATVARNSMAHLWHGKCLEGILICLLLHAWSHNDSSIPQICYPTGDRKMPTFSSPSMTVICATNRAATDFMTSGNSFSLSQSLTVLLPHLLNNIFALYERAAGILQDDIHFKLLCQSRVRFGRLLLAMRRRDGVLDDILLQNIVQGQTLVVEVKAKHEMSDASLVLPTKALTRLFVDAAIEAQSRMPILQAAPVQMAVASSLSILGVERKQAFYLRDFLQRLGPALIEARRVGAAEIGFHPSATLSSVDSSSDDRGGMSPLGINALLQMVCDNYGIPKSASNSSGQATSPIALLKESVDWWSAIHRNGDLAIKLDILSLCIEVSEAVPDFQCTLKYLASLLHASKTKLTLSSNTLNAAPLINVQEQSSLLSQIQRSVANATRYGMSKTRATYWDKCLVRSIELAEESYSSRLMRRTAEDISLASVVNSEVRKDPFIFNPFAKARPGIGQPVIVVGEQARFTVVLQNVLQVDVEIEDITLTSEGCDFKADHHSIVLGPLCSQGFTLTGQAMQEGDLTITGCKATIRGCHPENYLIVHGDWVPARIVKNMVTSAFAAPSSDTILPEVSQLSLKVTKALPKLSMLSTSLTQQAMMLLEGERTRLTLTLQNNSDLDIDFVLLTFEDSVTRRLEEALGNKDLQPADLYEIQNQIAHRPVVKCIDTEEGHDDSNILAKKRATFELELFGRPGLTDFTVLIDYAYLGMAKEHVSAPFYTRQLRHTFLTTVNGSIDIPRCSILSRQGEVLSTYMATKDSMEEHVRIGALNAEGVADRHCMLLLDVRNIWPQPLQVEFRVVQPSATVTDQQHVEVGSSVTDILQPGQMTRLLLPVPRLLITEPYTPIPSLDSKRQFVVSTSRLTIEAEAASRESFWYRERLLKCLQASWKEPSGGRQGQIDMRKGIRLSSRMIDALRINLIETTFSLKENKVISENLEEESTEPITKLGQSHFRIARNNMFSLVAHVHNRSTEELKLLLRIQPSLRYQPHNIALDLSKRFAWNGTLQQALHPPLQPNEIRKVELGIIAFAEGEYDVNGTVEEIRSRRPKTEASILEVGSGTERRMWHARNPCLIDVVG